MKESINKRIRNHYRAGIPYHELMMRVFPPEDFPRAHRVSANGGPPGCAMALGAAIRRMGGTRDLKRGTVWIPGPTV